MLISLVQNIALLIALVFFLGLLTSGADVRSLRYGLASGFLFGIICIVAMMTPLQFSPGVIYDGRSIVLSLAGLFGGPVSAVIAAGISSTFRIYLGGAGAVAGVLTIMEAALLGTVLHYLRRRSEKWVQPLWLLLFGFLVHVIMLALQLLIPGATGWDVLHRVGAIVLIVYPLGFLLSAQVFLENERSIKNKKDLQESEKLLKEIAANFPSSYVSIIKKDLSVGFTAGQEFKKQGLDPGQFVGLTLEQVFGEHSSLVKEKYLETFAGAETQFELFINNQNQCYRTVPLVNPNGMIDRILVVVENITERKRAEEALLESEERWKFALEGAGDGIWDWNAKTNVVYYSRQWKAMLGFEDHEIGNSLEEWDKRVHPDDRDHVYAEINKHFSGQTPVYVSEHRILCKDGTYKWILDRGKVIQRTGNGEPLRVIGTHTDISRRKQAEDERKKLQDQLNQAQKMESIGQLAGGVAHDLNNLLTPILGYGELLLGDQSLNPSHLDHIQEIINASLRARNLVHQLLAFGRKQVLEYKQIEMNQVVVDINKLLRRTIREDIRIEFALSEQSLLVTADVGQIEQVIMNLAVNAADAMPKGGIMTIETAIHNIDSAEGTQCPDLKPGFYVMLAVHDTGSGMDESTQERIFEPFFTTKGKQRSGLGLATAYGIITQHGGCIQVQSAPAKGATFRVYLPLSDKEQSEDKILHDDATVQSGSETILVVEDNKFVRDLTVNILRRKGYTVLVAENGLKALSLMDNHGGPIDLLLTDVIMPEMNGDELYTKASAKRPGLKVLYMSGYTDNVITHRGILDEGINFIQKPFTMNTLAQKIREALNR